MNFGCGAGHKLANVTYRTGIVAAGLAAGLVFSPFMESSPALAASVFETNVAPMGRSLQQSRLPQEAQKTTITLGTEVDLENVG
jgi:hypothetical protein